MKVCKFGGSSLANAEGIAAACDIVAADPERRVVVVSAPGKRTPEDTKVTDLLIACGEQVLSGRDGAGALAEVVGRYASIHAELGLPDETLEAIRADLEACMLADTSHAGRYMDALKAAGEDNCARLFASALRERGHAAEYQSPREAGLLLTADHGEARLLEESYANLAGLGKKEGIVVFPGFFGYTPEGDIATFSRGGSDITGAILAAAVEAEVYENFTDVDSVFAADPRIVPDAAAITEMTYREMRELAYAGFNVLHDEAIMPAVRKGIPIWIRNTHCPGAAGTTIVPVHRGPEARVVGIASADGFCSIYLSKYLMNREIGFGRRLLQIFEEETISYEHLPSGIDDLSVILKEENFPESKEREILARIQAELETDDVAVERGLAIIMIVGEGMRYNVGMAARATAAFAESRVNIEMMNQGSSEISMMFAVRAEERKRAVAALYRAFFGALNGGERKP